MPNKYFGNTPINESIKTIYQMKLDAIRQPHTIRAELFGKKMTNAFNPLNSISSMADAIRPLNEIMVESFRKKMISTSNPLNSIKESLNLLSADKWPLAYEDYSELEINEDNSISIGNNSLSDDQLQDIINQVVNDTTIKNNISFEQNINRIISAINSQKEPLIQKILYNFIFPLIVGIVLLFANYYITQTLNSNEKKYIIKQTKENIITKIDKSAKIGFLYLGNVVELLQKNVTSLLLDG